MLCLASRGDFVAYSSKSDYCFSETMGLFSVVSIGVL